MRIDKFLKVSRIIKRRTVAKDITNEERIFINDKMAKPSTEVKVNDIVKIYFGNKIVTIKVKNISDFTTKENALSLYELISEEKVNFQN